MMHRAFLLLFATALFAQDPGRGVNFYSLAKEQALGAQIAAEYRRTVGTIERPAVTAYFNDVGQRLVAAMPGAAVFQFTFELANDQTVTNEPAAFPGGPIFVTPGLVLAAASEAELAGMLAHSIAHVAARHGTKEATKGEILNISTIPLIYMGGWTGYAIRQGQELAIPLAVAQFRRQAELQADALAVQAMSAAGYDPAALLNYIERVHTADVSLPKLGSPFPGRDARLAALRTAIQNLPPGTYDAPDGLAPVQEEVRRLTVKPARAAPRLAR